MGLVPFAISDFSQDEATTTADLPGIEDGLVSRKEEKPLRLEAMP